MKFGWNAMRIMIDTNVLLSALMFPGQTINAMMKKVTSDHTLVLSLYIVDELLDVTERKFPDKKETSGWSLCIDIVKQTNYVA